MPNAERTADLPYELWNFTESGFGTRMEVDFYAGKEKEVTLARSDPRVRSIIAIKGRIVGCHATGMPCSPVVDIEVENGKQTIQQLADFGNHLAMVYGDHTARLEKLAPLTGFEIVTV